MNALHEGYVCTCVHPRPQMEKGEDSGLCESCGKVYDERLYEARLRQYTPHYLFDSLHDYLMEVDPRYQALVSRTPGD
jgi:hypothetical protein